MVSTAEGGINASSWFKPYAKRKAAALSHQAAHASGAASKSTRTTSGLRLAEEHWLTGALSRAIAIETSAHTCAQGTHKIGASLHCSCFAEHLHGVFHLFADPGRRYFTFRHAAPLDDCWWRCFGLADLPLPSSAGSDTLWLYNAWIPMHPILGHGIRIRAICQCDEQEMDVMGVKP